MAQIRLDRVGHSYGGIARALDQADILFEDGKTYALLGPSGCGKTTMLNIISGLLSPSEGRVILGERDVTQVRTAERNIAQVFQFPVIYRSKTVFGNLAFPLVCRNWDKRRIDVRVREIAELLGLSSRLDQSASGLTADEKQLVSLGRGLVRNDVAAILMDEPLTVIDPQSKFDLRRRIKLANEQTRHTVIYVTHDQNEAMTFADEILVMRAGRVVQRGTPQELFERPANKYVGTFIGSPGMNFIPADIRNDGICIGGSLVLPGKGLQGSYDGELAVGIRPEHLSLTSDADSLPATVLAVQDHGSVRVVDVSLATGVAKMKLPRGVPVPAGAVRLQLPADRLQLYVDGDLRVMPPPDDP